MSFITHHNHLLPLSLQDHIAPNTTNSPQDLIDDTLDKQAKQIAHNFFYGHVANTPVKDPMHIASWLGQQDDSLLTSRTLDLFMTMLDMHDKSLLNVLRVLANRLFLCAESQVLDRILEQMAISFIRSRTSVTNSRQRRFSYLPTQPTSRNVHAHGNDQLGSAPATSLYLPSSPPTTAKHIQHHSYNFGQFSELFSSQHALGQQHAQGSSFSTKLEDEFWHAIGGNENTSTSARSHAIAHTIAFSLLMLNTDLHTHVSPTSSITRMTKRQFIANTVQCLDPYQLNDHECGQLKKILRSYYYDIKHSEIQPPLFIQSRQSPTHGSPSLSSDTSKSTTPSFPSLTRLSPQTSLSSLSSYMPTWRPWQSPNVQGRKYSMDRASNLSASPSSVQFIHFPDNVPEMPNNKLVQTAIMHRKHLLQTAGERIKYRSWKKCSLELTSTKLYIVLLSKTLPPSAIDHPDTNTPGDSVPNIPDIPSKLSGQVIPNVHCVASLFTGIPQLDYTTKRAFVWMLVRPNGATDLMDAESANERDTWINAMNACNARWSRGPSTLEPSGIGSSRYGWEPSALSCLDNKGISCLAKWTLPPCNPYLSKDTYSDQLQHCQVVLRKYETLVASHIEARQSVDKIVTKLSTMTSGSPESRLSAKQIVQSNWHMRLEYLNKEVSKWRIYENVLKHQPISTPPPESLISNVDNETNSLNIVTEKKRVKTTSMLNATIHAKQNYRPTSVPVFSLAQQTLSPIITDDAASHESFEQQVWASVSMGVSK